MRRFIEYQHAVEIEKLAPAEATKGWERAYKRLQNEIDNSVSTLRHRIINYCLRSNALANRFGFFGWPD